MTNKNVTTIVLPPKTRSLIIEQGYGISAFINSSVHNLLFSKYCLFKVVCNENGKTFIGITDNYNTGKKVAESLTIITLSDFFNDLLMSDFKKLGYGDFTFNILCFVSSKDDAVKYREFMLNELLDNGISIYNDFTFIRYIKLFTNFKYADAVINYCFARKIMVTDLLNALIKKIVP